MYIIHTHADSEGYFPTEQSDLDAYLEWVFNVSKESLKTCPPVPLPLLAARLQTGHIVRVGARS